MQFYYLPLSLPLLDAHLQSRFTEIKYDCGQETWIFVRTIANYEGIPRRWDLERRKERINQKNTGVITALLFSRWRVIGQGGREGEGGRDPEAARETARISRGRNGLSNSCKLAPTGSVRGRDEKWEIVVRGDRASVVIELSRGDRGNDTSVERWKLIIVEEKKWWPRWCWMNYVFS